MIMSDIEAGATKTKNAVADVTEDAIGVAKVQGHQLERIARMVLRVVPLLPERTFSFLLDRVGLTRKSSPTTSVLVFAGGFASGFVAGGVTAALTTPLSGPAMRTKLGQMLSGPAKERVAKVVDPRDTLDEEKDHVDHKVTDGVDHPKKNADHATGNGR